MSREFLQNIVVDFNLEKFTRFFRDKNRSFAPKNRGNLSQYDDDNFRNGVKLGEIQFAQGREQMPICAFEANNPFQKEAARRHSMKKARNS